MVRCPECNARVSSHRSFCPECGASMREIARQDGERSPEELKRNRRNVLVIGAALIFGTALISPFSWIVFDANPDSVERHRAPVTIEAQQLYDAYRQDDRAANRRYRNREMVVSGEFVRVVPDGGGQPDLRLKTSDPERPLGVDLVEMSHEQAGRLRPGQRVTVNCRQMAGNREERWLQNCSIEAAAEAEATPPAKAGDEPAAPISAPPPPAPTPGR